MMISSVLLILLLNIHASLQYHKDSCISPYCICEGTALICDEFDSFSQLDFRRTTQPFSKLVLNPKFTSQRKLNIDSSLNLDGLRTNTNFAIVFHHINQIDVRGTSLFQRIKNLKTIEFIDSNLNFYYGDAASTICKNTNNDGLFANLNLDKLEFFTVKFETKMCPGLFKNSVINTLYFKDSNFNQAFEATAESMARLSAADKNADFNVHINHLKISNDESYLGDANRYVFRNTAAFDLIAEKLVGIHDHFFYTFKQLRSFSLYKANMNNLFDEGSMRWLKGLNSHTTAVNLDSPNVNLAQFENVLRLYVLTGRQVDFSDRNFCNFVNFPHKHLVFFLSDKFLEERVACTCTIYWLYKHYNVYKNFKIDNRFIPQHCVNVDDLAERIDACNLDDRVSQCLAGNDETKSDSKSSDSKNTLTKSGSTQQTSSIATILMLSIFFCLF